MKPEQFNTKEQPTWCPGCGNWAILMAVKQALAALGRPNHEICYASGIGCSSKIPHWVEVYGLHAIHGRPLPVATGIKLANNRLTVIAEGGDGDGYGIGTNHFVHAARRNLDITYITHNNKIYGLTQGQVSPTSDKGMKTKTTPFGAIEIPVNPLTVAITLGATYVARGFAGDVEHLKQLILGGLKHKGFALIDVFQPCVVFNKVNTFDFYRERVYKLEKTRYSPTDRLKAFKKAEEWGDKIPIGLFYKGKRKTYEDECPSIKEKPLVEHDISDIDIFKLLEEFV